MTGETGFGFEAINGRALTTRNYLFMGSEPATVPLSVHGEEHGGL